MCVFLKDRLSLRRLLLFLAVAAACLLGVALIAQYGFGLHPCELCMLQRYPYMAVVALGVAGVLVKNERVRWGLAALCLLLFLADGAIAAYHTGVELGWFKGPAACTSDAKPGESLEDMRREIMGAALVPCDQPMIHVLGISMAGWNAIAAALLAGLTIVALLVIQRKGKGA